VPLVDQLVAILDRAYDRKSWHGTNLRGSVRRVTIEEASARPAPGRHNIWEIVLHAAYWKYVVRRRLLGERRGSFPVGGSDWFLRPVPDASKSAEAHEWLGDLRLLDETHRALVGAVTTLRDGDLARPLGPGVTVFDIVAGAAAHDLYHAGQIQLLKRLIRSR
jgi:hypothetical protein